MNYYRIKELPEELRPRERLQLYGPSALSDAELIAILLRTGGKGFSALDLAVELLKNIGSLQELAHISFSQLSAMDHIGKAKAAQLLAAVELGRRVFSRPLAVGVRVKSPEEVMNYLRTEIGILKEEVFGAIYLDNSNRVLRKEIIHRGGRRSSLVDVACVLRRGLEVSATSLIVFHNHPSGNIRPSEEDLKITKKLKQACELVDLQLLDHIIITSDSYLSIREEGYL